MVFGAASTAAAFAGGVDALIACRAVMGAGAAFIMPATLSLLITVFADERERATAVGIWAATAGLGVALGPVVGGLLLDHFWWGSIFIVNVPLCALAIVVGRAVVPESRDPVARRDRLDRRGALRRRAGRARVGGDRGAVRRAGRPRRCSPPARSPRSRWPRSCSSSGAPRSRCSTCGCSANPRFSAASATIMVLFFALFGFLFLATQYLQFVLGLLAVGGRRARAALRRRDDRVRAAVGEARRALRHQARRDAGMLLFAAGLAVAATVALGQRLRPARASRSC